MLNKENLKDIYPLSPMQAGMLFHALLDSKSDAYFEQTTFHIHGDFNVTLWEKTWQILVQRHDILRTVFSYKKIEQPLQIVLKQSAPEFSYTDLRHLDKSAQQQRLMQYKQRDRQLGFDLTRDKLTRIALFQYQDDDYAMVWSFPHILLDGWCNGIIHEELLIIYEQLKQGKIPNLPPAPSYNRYIQWLEKQDKTAAAHYWKTYLANYAQLASLPKEKFLTPVPPLTEEVTEHELVISTEKYLKLQEIAVRNSVTLNILVQAIWSILLGIYNGVTDVIFGVTVSGRPAAIPNIERALGLFINTIPVRAQLAEAVTVTDLMRQLHQSNSSSKSYDFYPLTEIHSFTPLKHNLFDHLLIFENVPQGKDEITQHSLGFSIEQQEMYEHTHYAFVLSVLPSDNLIFKLSYNPKIYLAAQIARIATHLEHLLDRLLIDDSFLICDLDILPETEKKQLLQQFNPSVDDPVPQQTLVELFEAQVAQTPDHIAIQCEQQQLTYQELNAQANRVAHFLRQHYDIQADDRIALLMDRSLDLVVALWGILKAGAAYIPLDPSYPAHRIQYVLEHSQSKLVITQANYINLLENMRAIDFEALMQSTAATENLPIITQHHHLAYVIYTSGSTGLPKGVMLMQRNVVSFCANLSTRFSFTSRDTLYAVTTVTFDISVLELLGSLLLGMQVIIAKEENTKDPRQLSRELQTCSIVQTTPSRLQMIIENEGLRALTHLRVILVGGEALSQSLFEQLSSLPNTQVFNVYGPTETAIWSTTKLLKDKLLTIGTPLQYEALYILSDNLQLLPIGVIGEVCIGGAGVSRGYWRDEQKTQLQFVPNPFRPGEMLYKTGDLGRWLSNGEIEFLGRKDFQVKVRGFRIELGEIEHRLIQVDAVQQAVVVAREGNLVAYLVVNAAVQFADLKKYLLEWLPDYMVPTHFVVVEKLPLTPNGKIDRNALPKLENSTGATEMQLAPRTQLEQQLAKIWQAVLGITTVGVRDNFFELGGHSLKTVQMVAKIRQQCQREVGLTQFFQQPTIEGLVNQLSQSLGLAYLNSTAATSVSTPIICLPPILGYGLVFRPLSDLIPEYPWYGIDFVENTPNLLDYYVQLIRALHQKNYVILGFSIGASVAVKLADRLQQQGESVSDVILLDGGLATDIDVSEEEKEYLLERGLREFFTESMGNRDDTKRRMRGYAEFALTTLDVGILRANVHYIQSVGSDREDWSPTTSGNYTHHNGFGGHFEMLQPGFVEQNSQVIRQILEHRQF